MVLAGVGEAKQANVGQQLGPQPKQALLALLARRELSRGAVGGALEVHVAQAALAALGHEHAVAVARHVADDLVGGDVDDLGTDRDDDGGVLAALAVTPLALALSARLGAEPPSWGEVAQGLVVLML